MVEKIKITKLHPCEYIDAMSLAYDVFLEFGKSDYTKVGVENFKNFITSKEHLMSLNIYGAILNKKVIGVIATKNENSHISLFFVRPNFHKKGVGRKLFDEIKRKSKKTITVDSSTFAVDIYRKLGFIEKGPMQFRNGLKSVPMEFRLNKVNPF